MPPAESGESQKSYDLPPPVAETGSDLAVENPEKVAAGPETSKRPKSPKTSKSTIQIPDFSIPDNTSQQTTTVAPSTSLVTTPAIADDNDLIEKEWVAKAKKIIEETREDPYNQSKEITLFKADYMKKRYNKELKVSE